MRRSNSNGVIIKTVLMTILLLTLLLTYNAKAQLSSANYVAVETKAEFNPTWLTATSDVLTLSDGKDYPVFTNKNGGYAVKLKAKYFAYYGEVTSDVIKGSKVFLTRKGKPFIIIKSKKGTLYADYKSVKPKT